MKKNKLGFTLIELLAVVLIIGLLTSIALPQYRRSIARAEATEAMKNLKTIFDSAKRYKAATSTAPTKLQGLDVSFFDATSDTASTFSIGKFDYTFANDSIRACRANQPANKTYCLYFYYKLKVDTTNYGQDVMTCKLTSTGTKYDWLCEMLGTTTIRTNEYLME